VKPGRNNPEMAVLSNVKRLLATVTSDLLAWVISGQAWSAAQVGRMLFPQQRIAGSQQIETSQVRRVLVVHLFEIGDVVMLTPFLRELRRLLPDARITLIVKPETRDLVETCPYIDEVIAYDMHLAPIWRPLLLPWRAFQTARRLWTRRFDLAIVPSWLADNSYASFLACFSGARWRVGYSERVSARRRRLNRGFDRLFTQTRDEAGLAHDVRHNLAMISLLGGTVEQETLELWLAPDDEAFAQSFLESHGLMPGETVVALCPSAGHSALKQWPIKHFLDLARRIHTSGNIRILIVGGPGDTALGTVFEEEFGISVINAVGKTTLRQMAALLTHSRCFVANDAGPMHIAAAMRVPTVALFGSSCHHRYGPWGTGHAILSHELACSPCGRGHDDERCRRCLFERPRCLTEMTVDEVWEVVQPRLHSSVL
jgi:lipopolysaccharide heptosyltransferase II